MHLCFPVSWNLPRDILFVQNLRPRAQLELLHKAIVHVEQPRPARYVQQLHVKTRQRGAV
jgi:hypothetical protein